VLSDTLPDGTRVVLLAGRKPLGTLYAVYHYLEWACRVGFFPDGEHVPHLEELPSQGLRVIEAPRFDDRLHFCWNAHRGIKKYHSYWWTAEEWMRELDWMAKRRMNMLRIDMTYYSNFAGDAFLQAFPEIGPEKEEIVYPRVAGWPVEWGWPPEYRREQTRRVLGYGRKLGIRFVYTIDYGAVPFRFKERHPEIQYLPGNQYGEGRQISPYDPMCFQVEKRYVRKLIELFGTDHLYMATPYVEIDVGGGDPEKNLQMRIDACRNILRLVEEVDTEGVWVTDTWDMTDAPVRWNPDRVKRFLDSLPSERMYLYETAAELSPLHKTFGWWHGKRWAFGVINAFAGKEALHGNCRELIEGVRDAAGCPTCAGLFMVPELTHANVPFWDLTTRLAWQPGSVEWPAFLEDFVERRYGPAARAPALAAWENVARAVYEIRSAGDVFASVYHGNPWYQWKRGSGNCPLFSDTQGERVLELAEAERRLPLFREALDTLLEQRDRIGDNSLYGEDVLTLFRSYAACRFAREAAGASAAFASGDRGELSARRAGCMSVLAAIRDVLAVCPSYSVNRTIAEACSVPGHNRYLPETIRQNCINWRYTTNDVYEQFGGDYIPRTEAWLDLLDARLREGRKTVERAELDERFAAIDESYRKNGWSGPPVTGDPVEAVLRARAGRPG